MEVPFRLVDVFAERPLGGNQLCVIPDADGLTDEQMQALAREIGFSETTFVTEAGGDRYAMRIFTPTGELPFAGHPTLGTAFVLASEGRVGTRLTQVVAAGEYAVEVELDHRFVRVRQSSPTLGPTIDDAESVAAAAGLSVRDLHPDLVPQVVSIGLPHVMVPAASLSAVEHARPDERALRRLVSTVGADGYYLFAFVDGGIKARLWAPEIGVSEDPATGSAAGAVAAYLANAGRFPADGALVIRQGEEIGRPSVLSAWVTRTADATEVRVGGRVWVVGNGVFRL